MVVTARWFRETASIGILVSLAVVSRSHRPALSVVALVVAAPEKAGIRTGLTVGAAKILLVVVVSAEHLTACSVPPSVAGAGAVA